MSNTKASYGSTCSFQDLGYIDGLLQSASRLDERKIDPEEIAVHPQGTEMGMERLNASFVPCKNAA